MRLAITLGVSVAILATWIAIVGILAGIGLAMRRWLASASDDLTTWDVLLAPWTGLAVSVAILQLWHFLWPVDGRVTTLLCVGGIVGLLWTRPMLWTWCRTALWPNRRGTIAMMLLVGLWLANQSIAENDLHDSLMYHVPTVRWFESYAIVPGLANLHGRLGFNSSSFLYAAAIDVGPWNGRASHLVIGSLLWLASLLIIERGAALWRGARPNAPSLLLVAFAVPFTTLVVRGIVSSLSTDAVAGVLLAVTAACVAALMARQHFAMVDAVITSALLALTVTTKLTTAVFAGLAWGVLVWRTTPRVRLAMMAAAVPLLGSWLARGVMLSGYPLYPLRIGGVPVPWRVPALQAIAEAGWVTQSARYLDHNRFGDGWAWVGFWVTHMFARSPGFWPWGPLPVLILAVSVVLGWRALRTSPYRALFVVALVSVAVWFVTAPSIRYGWALLWIAAALATVPLTPRLPARRWPQLAMLLVGAQLGFAVVKSKSIGSVVTGPGPDHGLHPIRPIPADTFVTRSRLSVLVPRNLNACGDGPLLCTPHPAPNLVLRVPGDTARGFATDGPWEQLQFPNSWSTYGEHVRRQAIARD